MTATAEERIEAMCRQIPCLRHRPDVEPLDAESLDRWASTVATNAERMTVRFVLTIYNQHHPWACGRFDLIEASGLSDTQTWAVIQAWVQDPFVL